MKKFFITLMCIVMVVCFMPTVAMAGGDAYTALKGDIESAPTDGTEVTITLQGDITNMDTTQILTIKAGQNIVLNMDGHSITVKDDFIGRPIVNYGILKVIGNGTIDSTNSEFGGYGAINNFGNLTIENGTFKGHVCADGSAIYNRPSGTVVIENGYFEGRSAVYNGGTLTVNNGKFYTTSCNQTKDSKGGAGHWAYCINSHGNLIFNNGTVTGVQGALAIGGGTGLIYDGIFKTVICEHDSNGGPAHYAIYIAGETGGATATIYGGTYTAASKAAIMVGNDNKDGDGGINEKASVQIKGGTFTSKEGVSVMLTGPSTGTPVITGGKFSNNGVSRQGSEVTVLKNYVPKGTDVVEKISGEFTLAPADNAVAQVGDAGFTTLQAAINAAADGQTVKLLDDVGPITETLYINKNLTLDLGGKTLTTNAYYSFIVYPNISFTLQNGTLKNTSGTGIAALKSSTITVAKDAKIETAGSALFGSNNDEKEGHVTFNVYGTLYCEDIGIWGQGPNNTFNVDGATITSKYFGVYQNGSFGGCIINIKNSTITDEKEDGVAVYISNNKGNAENSEQGMQELTIENSIITGATAVEAKYTNINIKGSRTKITATGTPVNTTLNNNGPVTTGYAIAVTHNGAINKENGSVSPDSARGKITIEGGTFNGLIGIQEPLNETTKAEISISGGKFTQKLPSEYLVPGVVQNSNGTVYKPYYGGSIPTDSLKTARTEAIKAVTDYVNPADYEEAQQAEIKTIVDNAKKNIEAAKTADEIKAIEAAAKAELDKLETAEEMSLIRAIGETKFVARSKAVTLKNGKKAIKITWYDKNGKEVKFDGVEIFRSTKRYSGYGKEPIYVSKSGVYYNTAITPGTKYYYKVRGYVTIDGEKVYTDYSTKAWRTVK